MESKKMGLQKFTETKFEKLLENKLSGKVIDELSEADQRGFFEYMNKKINELEGEAFDKLWDKILPITAQSTRNQVWERNHNKTTCGISKLMQEYGRMPTLSEICIETGLSRVTVYKHLKEYKNSPQFAEIVEQFRFMREKVLARVFYYAVNGDTKAAKLFLEFTNNSGLNGNTFNTQNNFIQINQIKITQDNIQQLTPEQISQIEGILIQALPKS